MRAAIAMLILCACGRIGFGTRVLDVAPNDPAPAFDEVGIGAIRADHTGFHVYADDVTIAHAHIGCGN